MQKLIILSGAGISAESGLKTFRDSGGLWENYSVEEVATPQAFARNPALVLDFYNWRRAQAAEAIPNRAHEICVQLQQHFHVQVITQNVDDLHERAGSTHVLHLHGKLCEVKSTTDPTYIKDVGAAAIQLGDVCPKGGQLRPNIVWFGEEVPAIEQAAELVAAADILVVVGTSLQVYPAAGLVYECRHECPIYVIDPNAPTVERSNSQVTHIVAPATTGMLTLWEELTKA